MFRLLILAFIDAFYLLFRWHQAYLQQELEKLNELRNKVKQEGEVWDDLVSSSSQNSHLVSKSTRLWDSIMARKGKVYLLFYYCFELIQRKSTQCRIMLEFYSVVVCHYLQVSMKFLRQVPLRI